MLLYVHSDGDSCTSDPLGAKWACRSVHTDGSKSNLIGKLSNLDVGWQVAPVEELTKGGLSS